MYNKNIKFIISFTLIITCLICFCSSYIVCGFFGERGTTIIAHITGSFTALSCTGIGIFMINYGIKYANILKNNTLWLSFISVSAFSNLLMALGYYLYLFFAISPSNYSDPVHAASSMLFDVATISQALSILLGYLTILKSKFN